MIGRASRKGRPSPPYVRVLLARVLRLVSVSLVFFCIFFLLSFSGRWPNCASRCGMQFAGEVTSDGQMGAGRETCRVVPAAASAKTSLSRRLGRRQAAALNTRCRRVEGLLGFARRPKSGSEFNQQWLRRFGGLEQLELSNKEARGKKKKDPIVELELKEG